MNRIICILLLLVVMTEVNARADSTVNYKVYVNEQMLSCDVGLNEQALHLQPIGYPENEFATFNVTTKVFAGENTIYVRAYSSLKNIDIYKFTSCNVLLVKHFQDSKEAETLLNLTISRDPVTGKLEPFPRKLYKLMSDETEEFNSSYYHGTQNTFKLGEDGNFIETLELNSKFNIGEKEKNSLPLTYQKNSEIFTDSPKQRRLLLEKYLELEAAILTFDDEIVMNVLEPTISEMALFYKTSRLEILKKARLNSEFIKEFIELDFMGRTSTKDIYIDYFKTTIVANKRQVSLYSLGPFMLGKKTSVKYNTISYPYTLFFSFVNGIPIVSKF